MPNIHHAPLPRGCIAELVKGAPVAVLGFGISNRPLVPLLLRLGAQLHIYDQKSPDELGEQAKAAMAAGVRFYHDMEAMPLGDVRIIFRSPGIHPDTPALKKARESGVEISSEMAWFLEITPATVIGITGSDGKTTTTTLTAKMLEADGKRVWLGGNLGTPLLDRAAEMTADDFAVVELSSFQLYDLPSSVVPHRAAITNLSPNHLNWHVDMDDYVTAKTRIFDGARCERLVTNANNALTATMAARQKDKRRVTLFSSDECAKTDVRLSGGVLMLGDTPVVRADEIRLPGVHNLENMMTAVGLCEGLVSPEAMRRVAMEFGGVEHRLEHVRALHGVDFYNSSIDSSPTRTAAALSALKQPIVVICGGSDKHISFEPLAKALCERVRAVVLTGETAPKIAAAIDDCPDYDAERLTVVHEPLFEGAVRAAAALARRGDAVLLSPACASFDAFPNFMVRGETFRRVVLSLTDADINT